MKLVPIALVALSLLVGCSDGEKLKELERERAELKKEPKQVPKVTNLQNEVAELKTKLAKTGGDETAVVERSADGQDKKPLSKEVKALIEKAEKGDAKAEDQFQR